MKQKIGTVNISPTPEGYAKSLLIIIEHSLVEDDKEWARQEIINAFKVAAQFNSEVWGK